MAWTLWTTRNKMVIERVFPRRASDSFFKFLAFLQHWHPLARPRDHDRLQLYLDALVASARRLSGRSLIPKLAPGGLLCFSFLHLGAFVLWPQHFPFMTLVVTWLYDICFIYKAGRKPISSFPPCDADPTALENEQL